MISKKQPRILFTGPMMGVHPGWVSSPAEELAPRLVLRGYTCSLTSSLLNRYSRSANILIKIARMHKQVDILCMQVYGGPSFIVEDLTSLLARYLKLRIVMVLHGGEIPEFIRRYPRWGRSVLSRAHRIVTPSRFLSDAISAYGLFATIIPNAITLENYSFKIRNKINPHLLWMRTFHEIYNPLMAVNVLDQLILEYPEAILTMAGQEKGCLNEVKMNVHEKGLDSHVRFAGFLNAQGKKAEFQFSDIFINTNRVDNMPISLVEAFASGIPIVATAVGGVPYMIKDGENGLLVPNEDSTAMVIAIKRVLEEPGFAKHLSKFARKSGERHDWSLVLPQWEFLFHEMLDIKV